MKEKFFDADKWNALLEDLKSFLLSVVNLLKEDFFDVLIFTVLTAAFSSTVTNFLSNILVDIILYLNNTTYVAMNNFFNLLFNVFSIILIIISLICITLLSLFEIGGLLHCYSMNRIGQQTDIKNMIASGIRTCQKALSPRNWPMIVYIMILLPLTKVLSLSTSMISISLPGFIEQHLIQHSWTKYYVIFYIIVVMIAISYIFSINIFTLHHSSFTESCKLSQKISKGKFLQTLGYLAVLAFILNLFLNAIVGTITVSVSDIMSYFKLNIGTLTSSYRIGKYIIILKRLLRGIFIPIINNAGLTVLYYRYMKETQTTATFASDIFKKVELPKKVYAALFATLAILLSFNLYDLFHKKEFLFEPVKKPMVCAHRGDNVHAPENTLPAFELAMHEGLPWIELDVHQTSDDVIVVSHDESIKRMTGVDKQIHELTFEELSTYKVLDSYPGDYQNVTIPSLEQVFDLIKNTNMNVQVEIKPTEFDRNIEESIIRTINENGMRDRVLIISLNYDSIVRIKEIDPEIKTAYCMVLAAKHIEDVPYSDNFSIEENNITPQMVNDVHEKGSMVFCWTVDKEDNIQYLVSCGVDVIGTDDPMLVLAALEKADYSGGLSRIINVLINYLTTN